RGPTRAQIRKVTDLEAQLAELDAAHRRDLAAIVAERAALGRKQAALEGRCAARQAKLTAAQWRAREALA
ncbi:MAG: hypothetical protein ACHP9T_11615, partial [Caulobacterales bacterium]